MARVVLDAMLGKLATYLRMCGHDAAYALDRGVERDDRLRSLARREGRRLVTRDADLAARAGDALLVHSKDSEGQLREVRAAGLSLELTEPERCAECNAELERVAETETTPEYAPDATDARGAPDATDARGAPDATDARGAPDAAGEPVWRCPACGQHFWRGSHWDDVGERLRRL